MTGITFMKSLRVIWFFVFFTYGVLVGLMPVYAEAGEVKWIFIGFTKYRDALYIEMNSISHSSYNIAGVWSLIAPSKKSKYLQEVKRELKKFKKSARGFKYSEILNEIDCTNSRIRYLQIVYLNKDGGTIHTASTSDLEWKPISSGSLWNDVRNTICEN